MQSDPNPPLTLFWTEYNGQLPGQLGKWDVLGEIWPSQRLDVEKAQSCRAQCNRPCLELAFSKQIGLILPNMIRSQQLWRAVEIPGKVLYRVQVGVDRVLRVVATLELIQHLLPKMGHKSLLVTRGLHSQQCSGKAHAVASAASED